MSRSVSKLSKSAAKHFKHHSELPMRLDKYLMMYQGFYKSKCDEFIKSSGAVQIYDDRKQLLIPKDNTEIKHNTLIYPHQRIIINNIKLDSPQFEYYMLYKPNGIRGDLYEFENKNHHRLLSKWLKHISTQRLRLVGRLDMDCSGLLLSTNDGILTDLLKSPTISIDRVYRVDITRKHHENKFSNMHVLESKGVQLRKDIGWIAADKVVPRGRLDKIDTVIFDEDENIDDNLSDNKKKIETKSGPDDKSPKKSGDIPLAKTENIDDDENLKPDKKMKKEKESVIDKEYLKYLRSLKRQTQWDVYIKHGQHKIMKRMIKNLGFRVENIERIGYGPFMIDKHFKEWDMSKDKNKNNIITTYNESDENKLHENISKQLYEKNYVKLNEQQINQLWECVGGLNIGIIARLQSLFERANKLNDIEFMQWLQTEHQIKV